MVSENWKKISQAQLHKHHKTSTKLDDTTNTGASSGASLWFDVKPEDLDQGKEPTSQAAGPLSRRQHHHEEGQPRQVRRRGLRDGRHRAGRPGQRPGAHLPGELARASSVRHVRPAEHGHHRLPHRRQRRHRRAAQGRAGLWECAGARRAAPARQGPGGARPEERPARADAGASAQGHAGHEQVPAVPAAVPGEEPGAAQPGGPLPGHHHPKRLARLGGRRARGHALVPQVQGRVGELLVPPGGQSVQAAAEGEEKK